MDPTFLPAPALTGTVSRYLPPAPRDHPEWLPERQGRARIRARRRRREAAEGPMTAMVFHGRHGRLRHRSLARGLAWCPWWRGVRLFSFGTSGTLRDIGRSHSSMLYENCETPPRSRPCVIISPFQGEDDAT